MPAHNYASLNLRTQLQGLSSAIAACNANDRNALGELHQQLTRLRVQLERDHVLDQITPVGVAARIAEHLMNEGKLTAPQGLALIENVVKNACERLDVERPSDTLTVDESGTTTQRASLQLLSSRRLGEILVQLSLLDAKQVERALAYQHARGCRLGEALVELGMVSRETVQNALKVQRKRNDPQDPWRNRA